MEACHSSQWKKFILTISFKELCRKSRQRAVRWFFKKICDIEGLYAVVWNQHKSDTYCSHFKLDRTLSALSNNHLERETYFPIIYVTSLATVGRRMVFMKEVCKSKMWPKRKKKSLRNHLWGRPLQSVLQQRSIYLRSQAFIIECCPIRICILCGILWHWSISFEHAPQTPLYTLPPPTPQHLNTHSCFKPLSFY